MKNESGAALLTTHVVFNQPPPLEGYNRYAGNNALGEALQREGAAYAHDELTAIGAELGSPDWIRRGAEANRNPPQFQPFDRHGNRRDEFDFHPAWHECMHWLKRHGVHHVSPPEMESAWPVTASECGPQR